MAAGLWIWVEEWGKSGSESSRTFDTQCRYLGAPWQEMNSTVYVISDSEYI